MLWSVVSTYRANYSMPSAHRGVTMSMTTQRGVCSLLHPTLKNILSLSCGYIGR
jgi:hypothetical protein